MGECGLPIAFAAGDTVGAAIKSIVSFLVTFDRAVIVRGCFGVANRLSENVKESSLGRPAPEVAVCCGGTANRDTALRLWRFRTG